MLALALLGAVAGGSRGAAATSPSLDPLADPEAGFLLVRAFKARAYQGSPVIGRVLEHPQTGELLMVAGTSLFVFDGVEWTEVPAEAPAARCLAVDAQGRVWLGGVDQLGYAERDDRGHWAFHSLIDRLPETQRKPGRVWDCVIAADAVWFGTETEVFRWHDDRFTVFTFPSTGTLLSASDEVYFQIKNKSLQQWDGAQFRERSTDPLVAGPSIMRLFATPDGTAEGMTSAGDFFRLQRDHVDPIAPHAKASLGTARLVCAWPRAAGGWYVGTDSAGLLLLDREGNLARRVGRSDGFTDGPIADLTQDRDGALWAGTFSGVYQIEQPEAATFFGSAQGLPDSISNGMERYEGQLYVGTPAGVVRLVPGRREFELVPGSPRLTQRMLVTADGLLVAHPNGIARLRHGEFTSVYRSDNPCTSLATSRRDPAALLVGRSAGFTVLHADGDGQWHEVKHFADLGQVRDVIDDAQGVVWLATSSRGVHRLVPGSGADPWASATVTTYDRQSGTLAGTSDSTLIVSTPLGVAFNTPSGQVRFEPAANRLVPDERFRLGDRLIRVLGITARQGSEGWGIANFGDGAPRFGRIAADGPSGAQFTPVPASIQEVLGPIDAGRILIEGDGDRRVVWARTIDGLVRLRPSALVNAAAEPPVLLTRLEAAGSAQPLRSSAVPRFPYSRQPYVVGFHRAQLSRGPAPDYETRLAGWNDQWSGALPAREARFTALPAAGYRFEVRAGERRGGWSAPATIAFTVTPPWWFSHWAIGGYALLIVGGIVRLVQWRVGRVEVERLRLERLVATRTSELAAARDAAEAANRAKSAFLASMSHELRTPLNGVLGYAQVLQADRRLLPDQRERLRVVQQSGEHLLQMINDVLDLAQIEAGKLTLRPAPFALGSLVRDCAAVHAAAAARKGLRLDVVIAADVPAGVEGDAQKLRQIFDNLLGNAVKFTATGGVTLRVQAAAAPVVKFTVEDTGPGIDPVDCARLFQPFEQAARARPNAPGAGLGLAISRALARRLGGELTVASEMGRGSVFILTVPLPAADVALVPGAIGGAIAGYEGPRRAVVIVDDNAVNRTLLVDLLTPLGFECREFASGPALLDHLAAAGVAMPDAAILDLRMADMDGLELTRRLREWPAASRLKILLTTASVLTFGADEGRRAGGDDYLPKPFRTTDLLAKLGALLHLRWRESDSRPPFAAVAAPTTPWPDDVRQALREQLAQGDIAAVRTLVADAAIRYPAAEVRWAELDAAAAAFELSRLRQLVEQP